MRQGRAQRAAGLQHRRDAFLVEIEAVENQIDPGARRIERRLAADRMGDRLPPEAMALAHDDVGLFLGEGRDQLAIGAALDAVERDLDAIDPVLDLAAHLLDRLVAVGDELADRGLGHADPGRIPVGEALMRGQIRPRRHDPRPVEEAGADRVADRQRDLARIARRADRGVARGRDLLGEEHAAQRAEFHRAVEVDVLLALGVAVGEVGVDVDEARHHERAGMVDQPVGLRPARRRGFGTGIVEPALAVEDQHAALLRLVLVSGEQAAATDKGFHGRCSRPKPLSALQGEREGPAPPALGG